MADGRKKNGGPRDGAGRKPNGLKASLAELLDAGWPKAKRLETVKKLADLAAGGDLDAAKILLSYAYGKPTEHKEISGSDGAPLRVVFEWVDNGIGGGGTEN